MNSFSTINTLDSLYQVNFTPFKTIPEYILSEFCLCDVGIHCQKYLWKESPDSKKNQTFTSRTNRKTIDTYDFTTNIQALIKHLEPVLGTSIVFTRATRKSQIWNARTVSKRRSKYTGVTKNSSNYQTLIVVDGKKIYVGSYPMEEYAAVTYDFYSLLLHGPKATTNFSYTPDDVMKMLEVYEYNDHKFEPERFIRCSSWINL